MWSDGFNPKMDDMLPMDTAYDFFTGPRQMIKLGDETADRCMGGHYMSNVAFVSPFPRLRSDSDITYKSQITTHV